MSSRLLLATACFFLFCSSAFAQVERVWLGHRTNDPSQLVVNWMTKELGESDGVYHYSVSTGIQSSEDATTR